MKNIFKTVITIFLILLGLLMVYGSLNNIRLIFGMRMNSGETLGYLSITAFFFLIGVCLLVAAYLLNRKSTPREVEAVAEERSYETGAKGENGRADRF